MDDQIQNKIEIQNQGIMEKNITQKETLIFKRLALVKLKFQQIVVTRKEF